TYAETESLARESLPIRAKKEPYNWMTFHTQSILGGALLGQKKFTEAEPLLFEGYDGMKKREQKKPQRIKDKLTSALERLVKLYEDQAKSIGGEKWRKMPPPSQP